MEFDQSQEVWARELGLSPDHLAQIQRRLPSPKYLDFITNSLGYMPSVNSADFMLRSYNNIKDPTWPVCNDLHDLKNLPQHIIEECRTVHGFDYLIYDDPNIDQDRWRQFESGSYPVSELVRYKNVILDVEDWIRGKKVVDFACHGGMISLLALHVGAKWVTASNVRPEFVELAQKTLTLSGHKNFDTSVDDIHDYDNNTKKCQHADVVLLYGIMYHVHDHYQILSSIAKAQPPTVMIDTVIPEAVDTGLPLMKWWFEDSENVWNGWHNDDASVLIGAPNVSWFEMVMSSLGYKMAHEVKYYCAGYGEFDRPKEKRSIMVFEKHATTRN